MSQGIAQMMEDPGLSRTDNVPVSGKSMGFSIGIAFLLLTIFSSSIAVTCCHYRDRFRSRRQSSLEPDVEQPPLKPEATGKVYLLLATARELLLVQTTHLKV